MSRHDDNARTQERILADVYKRVGEMDKAQLLASVDDAVGPLNRRLWGWAIRRMVTSPLSRFYTDLPRRGLEGATANMMSGLWAMTTTILALAIPAQFLPSPVAARAITATVVIIALTGLGISGVWSRRAYKHTKRWRRSNH